MNERGAATVLGVALVAVVLVLALGLARLADAAVLRARAETAAECGALAGAGVLAENGPPGRAAAQARRLAGANGATVVSLTVIGARVQLTVVVDADGQRAWARAAAEAVDPLG